MRRRRLFPTPLQPLPGEPFADAQEAWFWFMQCHQARIEGARIVAGLAAVPRPCEPEEVLRIVDRLYRHRRLVRDHLMVLAHYGRRLMAPDPARASERRAAALWDEALRRLGGVLRQKGIVA